MRIREFVSGFLKMASVRFRTHPCVLSREEGKYSYAIHMPSIEGLEVLFGIAYVRCIKIIPENDIDDLDSFLIQCRRSYDEHLCQLLKDDGFSWFVLTDLINCDREDSLSFECFKNNNPLLFQAIDELYDSAREKFVELHSLYYTYKYGLSSSEEDETSSQIENNPQE